MMYTRKLFSTTLDRRLAPNAMYDFCLTFPYAFLLGIGGLIGFITKGSIPSLAGGVGTGAVLALCGKLSLAQYHQGKLCRPATVVSLVLAALLTVGMFKRFQATKKVMPAGVVTLVSALMCCFYVWNLIYVKLPKSAHQKG